MLNKQLADLQENDIESLVTNKVAERRDLEFKRSLPGRSDSDKKEFLADVTAFANAVGGDLIFGIEEQNGVAKAVTGIDTSNADSEILRLESIISDCVEPRMSVSMHSILLASGRAVLILRIPSSFAAPHCARFNKNRYFYTRGNGGKREMDVYELRQAFTQSEQIPQQLRQLHDQAVAATQGVDMPFIMGGTPTAIFSIMPMNFLRERRDLTLTRENSVLPVNGSNVHSLPILEGMLSYTPAAGNGGASAYTLTHRGGRIDAAWTLGRNEQLPNGTHGMVVWPFQFDNGVGEMANSGFARLMSYGVRGPWLIMVSLIGIKGATMLMPNNANTRPAWRERARLPELLLDHVNQESLLPLFEAFWLVFGVARPKAK